MALHTLTLLDTEVQNFYIVKEFLKTEFTMFTVFFKTPISFTLFLHFIDFKNCFKNLVVMTIALSMETQIFDTFFKCQLF